MYALHIGLHEDVLTPAMIEHLGTFAKDRDGSVYVEGDAWQEWGGVEGNVSTGVDLALKHVVFRFEGRKVGSTRAIADAVESFPVKAMRSHGSDANVVAVVTNADDWSHVGVTLTVTNWA